MHTRDSFLLLPLSLDARDAIVLLRNTIFTSTSFIPFSCGHFNPSVESLFIQSSSSPLLSQYVWHVTCYTVTRREHLFTVQRTVKIMNTSEYFYSIEWALILLRVSATITISWPLSSHLVSCSHHHNKITLQSLGYCLLNGEQKSLTAPLS